MRYYDVTVAMQIIGSVYNNPSLLDLTDKYSINEEDFVEPFHKVAFGAIYKIYELGAEKISLKNITDFLASRPKSLGIFQSQNGEEWLLKVAENAMADSFDYYYSRLKKMTLLRAYDAIGLDVTDIYDPDNILDSKKRQAQEEFLDNTPLLEIAQRVEDKIDEIKMRYVDEVEGEPQQAGEGIDELLNRLALRPDVGVPLYGNLVNTVTRGARLRKLYLRSAPSGQGKTRTMIADVCNIGCDYLYNDSFGWIKNGTKEPALYITTEQELEEIQTMMIAFISYVDEEHILNNRCTPEERERVLRGAQILKESPIYIVELPDFSLADVENIIKFNIRTHGVKYVFMDYIMSSLKILGEVANRTGGIKLREDNILFMLSRRLKDIANEYGVFVLSSTQLSGDWRDNENPDQSLLRGAKSIADSIDLGAILLPPSQKDLDALEPILTANGWEKPNMKISIYKNRRGRYKSVYLWAHANLGVCRVDPFFCTTWSYELVPMEDLKIVVEDQGAFGYAEVR